MAALAAVAVESTGSVGEVRAGFGSIATKCECCGASSALYFFNPFRAFCVEHGPRLRPPAALDAAPEKR